MAQSQLGKVVALSPIRLRFFLYTFIPIAHSVSACGSIASAERGRSVGRLFQNNST